MKIISLVIAFSLSVFCMESNAADASSDENCQGSGGLEFICDFSGSPEDLVIVPGTDWVVASVFSRESTTGLYLIDAVSKISSPLYSPQVGARRWDMNSYSSCPGEPDLNNFETHGLSIAEEAGRSGFYKLYAVSHGNREAIEVFDLSLNQQEPQLTWLGCVLMPEGLDANDVSTMRDGSILVTVLMHPGNTFEDLLSGQETGGVYKWTPGSQGFVYLEGSALPGNNGIQVSTDESEIFVAASGLSAIITLSNSNPTRVLRRTRTLEFAPDNIVYDANGFLLTAGMRNDEPTCSVPAPISDCPRGSIAVSIHPQTMQDRTILSTPPNPNFSGATMAIVPGGREVWIGSFMSTRIAYQLYDPGN